MRIVSVYAGGVGASGHAICMAAIMKDKGKVMVFDPIEDNHSVVNVLGPLFADPSTLKVRPIVDMVAL